MTGTAQNSPLCVRFQYGDPYQGSSLPLISRSEWSLRDEKINLCSSSVFSTSPRTGSFSFLLLQADPDLSTFLNDVLRSEESVVIM